MSDDILQDEIHLKILFYLFNLIISVLTLNSIQTSQFKFYIILLYCLLDKGRLQICVRRPLNII